LTIAIRPENIRLAEPGGDATNVLSGTVESLVYLGNMLECTLTVGPQRIRVQLHPSAAVRRGANILLRLPVEHCLTMRSD
jgi:ABC-type sugar transport system ATPase subunit